MLYMLFKETRQAMYMSSVSLFVAAGWSISKNDENPAVKGKFEIKFFLKGNL